MSFVKPFNETNYNLQDGLYKIIIHPKVRNGIPAELGEIPYLVAFKRPPNSSVSYLMTYCGGSIIKPTVVISAAHCFVPMKEKRWKTFLGNKRVATQIVAASYAVAENLLNKAETPETSKGQWRKLAFVKIPFQYRFPQNDLAIVHLQNRLIFNDFVKPIAYTTKPIDFRGFECLIVGYGKKTDELISHELRKAFVTIQSEQLCYLLLGKCAKIKNIVCSVDKVTNVLEGDSGGPLVCNGTGDPKEGPYGIVIGVASFICPGIGAGFTRVSNFDKFILTNRDNNAMTNLVMVLTCLFSVLKFTRTSFVVS